MATMQAIIDLARIPLNDARKVRYTDPDLLKFANAAVFRTYEVRPDLKPVGSWGTPFAALALGGTFPLEDRLQQTVADYVSGRAELKDDENVNSARAQALMQMFVAELTT